MMKKHLRKCIFLLNCRSKTYGIWGEVCRKSSLFNIEYIKNSVHSIYINNHEALTNYKECFPNAITLIINDNPQIDDNGPYITQLKNSFSLKQFTKLCFSTYGHQFYQFIELLHDMPNIHTLEIYSKFLNDKEVISYQRSESYRLLSIRNNIKKLMIGWELSWKVTKFLINLCPQLIHLNILYISEIYRPLLRFLFTRKHQNARHLSSLIIPIHDRISTKLTDFISENFTDIHWMSITVGLQSKLYFWW